MRAPKESLALELVAVNRYGTPYFEVRVVKTENGAPVGDMGAIWNGWCLSAFVSEIDGKILWSNSIEGRYRGAEGMAKALKWWKSIEARVVTLAQSLGYPESFASAILRYGQAIGAKVYYITDLKSPASRRADFTAIPAASVPHHVRQWTEMHAKAAS